MINLRSKKLFNNYKNKIFNNHRMHNKLNYRHNIKSIKNSNNNYYNNQ